jgi:hypothetical protein
MGTKILIERWVREALQIMEDRGKATTVPHELIWRCGSAAFSPPTGLPWDAESLPPTLMKMPIGRCRAQRLTIGNIGLRRLALCKRPTSDPFWSKPHDAGYTAREPSKAEILWALDAFNDQPPTNRRLVPPSRSIRRHATLLSAPLNGSSRTLRSRDRPPSHHLHS